jgi:hypothetical protein
VTAETTNAGAPQCHAQGRTYDARKKEAGEYECEGERQQEMEKPVRDAETYAKGGKAGLGRNIFGAAEMAQDGRRKFVVRSPTRC